MFTQEQVTALTAQAANAATYDAYDVDGNLLVDWQINDNNEPVYIGSEIATRGIGVYGQTPAGLTTAGYLKPGTLNLITTPDMTLTVLNNPAVWSGQQGINSLLDYLNDPLLQNSVQVQLMQGAYQGLIDSGVLIGNESPRYQATFLQPATRYGVDAVVAWLKGVASADLVNNLKVVARQGQYAIDFISAFEQDLNAGFDLPGFENTIERTDLDQLFVDLVGNEKIPAVDYADTPVVTAITGAELIAENDEDSRFRLSPGNNQG